MILSYNPMLCADEHRICAGRGPDEADRRAMARADAVLLGQGRQEALFRMAKSQCAHVFPDYTARYDHPGKIGDITLFTSLDLPHPRTHCFERAADCPAGFWERADYPLVLKSTAGGEGSLVFLIGSPEEARERVAVLAAMERSGISGFLAQEFIPAGDKTLRVALVGEHAEVYWRTQDDAGEFRHNLGRGGRVERAMAPAMETTGEALARRLARGANLDLAGVDVLFNMRANPPEPLLLEINYYFGRDGFGGNAPYHALLQRQVDRWLLARGITPSTTPIDEEMLLNAEYWDTEHDGS